MGKLIARLLLLLVVAAGIGYLLFPTAYDQYTLYRNVSRLQTYRSMTNGLGADHVADLRRPSAEWNNAQLRDGIVPEGTINRLFSLRSGEKRSHLEELAGEDPLQRARRMWADLLALRNRGVTSWDISSALERFIRAGETVRPLEAQNPFRAAYSEAASLLYTDRNGVVGILEFPRIGVILPVYARQTQERLASGLFYGPGSSLPVGGLGTHALLAGSGGLDAPEPLDEIGLTGPKLLEDMNRLEEGDLFLFSFLGQNLLYRIDRMETAPPEDTIILERSISSEQMTILSATRDGQWLTARGIRIAPNENEEQMMMENAVTALPNWVSVLVLAAPVMAFGLLVMLITEFVIHYRYKLPTERKQKE